MSSAAKSPLWTKSESLVIPRVPLYACQGSVLSSKPPFNSSSSRAAKERVLTASDARTARIAITAANREAFISRRGLAKRPHTSYRPNWKSQAFVLAQYIQDCNITEKM